jgi:aphidicolan-16beta-ol synthase/syn-copalyl-diphosphate synthase
LRLCGTITRLQAPYAYELLLCFLNDGSGNDTFPTAEQKYYSAAANRHLSTLCRMENDYGSVTRDRVERNLNFIDFPEFFDQGGAAFTSAFSTEQATPLEAEQKAQLLRLAQYERESYRDALRRLDELVAGDKKAMRKMQLLRVMTNVTDSWGQMYVVKDLGRPIDVIVQANDQQLKGQWVVPANA